MKKDGSLSTFIRKHYPRLLIGAGLLIVALALGTRLYTEHMHRAYLARYEQMIADARAWDEAQEAAEDVDVPTPAPVPQEPAPLDTPAETEAALPDTEQMKAQDGGGVSETENGVSLLGVLRIPRIELEVAIGEGVGNDTLRYAVGHFEDTALPGQAGNTALIGHRNYMWGEFFYRLDEMQAGDEIITERGGRIYTYEVTQIMIVEPDDVWVLEAPQDGAQITLITCTPIGKATQRLVVRGELRA